MTEAAAQSTNVASATPDTMAWDSRARRVMMIYLPLSCFVLILLFPFYWMAITSFKPNAELLNYREHNPFWISSPTLAHIKHLLFNTAYPTWLKTTMFVAIGSTFLSLFASTLAAYAIERLRFRGSPYVGLGIYLAYLVPPSILFIPLATVIVQFGLFDSPMALILVYPTFLVPFCTWLLIGYFKSIPYELEECALVDGATRLQILRRITARLIAAAIEKLHPRQCATFPIFCLRQNLLRPHRIIRIPRRRAPPQRLINLRRNKCRRRLLPHPRDVLDDRFLINRHRQRLPHANIRQRIHADDPAAVARAVAGGDRNGP